MIYTLSLDLGRIRPHVRRILEAMNAPGFIRAYPPATPSSGSRIWLIFENGEPLVRVIGTELQLPRADDLGSGFNADAALYLGTLDGLPCLAIELSPDTPTPDDLTQVSLRSLFGHLPDSEYSLVGYASQMLYWRRMSLYCPVCGHTTEQKEDDWGRLCPQCNHIAYPHVTPAVLILVHDGDRLLLASKPGWGDRCSILAGFVEPGESLEECVRREVMEEVSVIVGELTYVGSQPWAFPHQLMVGFNAAYVSGTIQPDQTELERAAWFTPTTLPELPPPLSLSRQMIDKWVAAKLSDSANHT